MNWSPSGTRADEAVRVTVRSCAGLLDDLGARMATRQGFAVATLNLDHAVKLRRLPDFRAAYEQHTHVTADGNPVVWLQRLSGEPVDLVPGSDLVMPIAALCARHGVPLTLFGATDAALAGAADALLQQNPGLRIALCLAPPMGFDPAGAAAAKAIAQIGDSGAGVCLVALGAPKQEIFAARAFAALPHVGFLSIGAGLDFLAGTQRRAPRVVQRLAGEWLWRLAGNPRRLWSRYAACLLALPVLTLTALRGRWAATGSDRGTGARG